MTSKISLYAAAAATMLSIPAMADARSLRAVGSSTVYPFAKAVAERVARANPKLGTPIIESTGTGAGIKLFCAGVGERFPDIANASRRMKASEAKQCAANGVKEVTEIQVGLDGLALATAKGTPLSRPDPARHLSGARQDAVRQAATGPRPGRTSTPSCRRFRSASMARRRPAARATRSAS